MESYYYHHGLRFASKKVLNYVKDRDIIDAGAFNGDSLTVLSNYTQQRVFSYEISPTNFKVAAQRGLRFNSTKHTVFNVGLSDHIGNGSLGVGDSKRSDQFISQTGNQNFQFKLTSIDEEARKYNLTVGFIKADIEGSEMMMLRGGFEIMKRDHPILSIALYHSEDLFLIPNFIDSVGGYQINFRTEAGCSHKRQLYELRLFAIPLQLD